MRIKKSNHETEIKLPVENPAKARRLLRAAGYRVQRRRHFEVNLVYDTPQSTLRASQRLLRLRQAGKDVILTYKGAPVAGKHKSREELEISVSDAGAASLILERLGFSRTFRYEKYRTEYRGRSREGVITLDETPAGTYLELEGPPGWIDRTAASLGFQEKDYITLSYGGVWLEHCQRLGIAPPDMVF